MRGLKILVFVAAAYSSRAFGVDGYRQFKWGMSTEQVKREGCTLIRSLDAENAGRLKMFVCFTKDLSFEGKTIEPEMGFVDDRLYYVGFSTGTIDDFDRLATVLKEKYGLRKADGFFCVKRFKLGMAKGCKMYFDKDGSVMLELYESLGSGPRVALLYRDWSAPVGDVANKQLKDDI